VGISKGKLRELPARGFDFLSAVFVGFLRTCPCSSDGDRRNWLDQPPENGRVFDSQFAMKHRIERVCEVLKRELGRTILRELTFSTPLVTISGVEITPDLKQAHVYVSALGNDAQRQNVLTVLEQNRGMLQAQVSKRVVLKHTPHLNFKLDDSIERGSRVINILDDLGLDEAK
jgi:ribosome-binding factor A